MPHQEKNPNKGKLKPKQTQNTRTRETTPCGKYVERGQRDSCNCKICKEFREKNKG